MKNELINEFQNNGYVLLKNIYSKDEIAHFRGLIKKMIEKPLDVESGDSEFIKSNVLVRSKEITDFFFNEKLINKIKDVLGDNFHVIPETSVMKSQYGRWHKDTTSIELFGHDFHKSENFRVVNVAIYCQNNNEYGGGLDIVPGSHKNSDEYTDFYKKEAENAAKKDTEEKKIDVPKPKKPNFFKRVIRYALRRTPIIKNYFKVNEKNEHPLDSADTKAGKYKVPTVAGDVVIFDLRLDHKASWPSVQIDNPNDHIKYAFFAICGSDNLETKKYREYLDERSQSQQAYAYLKNYQVPDYLSDYTEKFQISVE